jgi:CYTH domain-containing protein
VPSEIERKFLVERLPEELADEMGDDIVQGYLATGDDEVRVRRRGDEHVLTVKRGSGLARDEVEVPLNREAFAQLWPFTEGRRVEKQRVTTPVEGALAEVDVYRGALEGLVTVEVEFADAETANAFSPPSWFGREVTGDARYSNQSLAVDGSAMP